MFEMRASGLRRAPLPALLFALSVTACGTAKTPTEPVEPVDTTATFTRVQSEIFTPTCALSGCHGNTSPQLGMNLSAGRSYGQIVGVASVESSRPRIVPGDPASSYLVSKVTGDATILGSRMPLNGPFLSATTQKPLTDWVRRGAPND